MIVHFIRTLYHRTGLYAAVGWARAWVVGEVVDTGVTVCVLPDMALVVPSLDAMALRIPSYPTAACRIPSVPTLTLRG